MNRKSVLLIDAIINLFLGLCLLGFSPYIINLFGLPPTDNYFYPNILGSVFIGITIALIVEAFRKSPDNTGLGLIGAICINICGGIVLFLWLVSGGLDLPLKGSIILWILDTILLVISLAELFMILKDK